MPKAPVGDAVPQTPMGYIAFPLLQQKGAGFADHWHGRRWPERRFPKYRDQEQYHPVPDSIAFWKGLASRGLEGRMGVSDMGAKLPFSAAGFMQQCANA